jgi:hypothetical protein
MSRIGSDELRDLQHAHGAALLAYFHRRVEPAEEAAVLLNDLLLVLWRRAASAPTGPEEVRMWMFPESRSSSDDGDDRHDGILRLMVFS